VSSGTGTKIRKSAVNLSVHETLDILVKSLALYGSVLKSYFLEYLVHCWNDCLVANSILLRCRELLTL
jgi:hypothetical protein